MQNKSLEHKVLDHGWVRLRNISGPSRRVLDGEGIIWTADEAADRLRPFDADDTDPAQAARMSFEQMDSERTREDDLRLADYLLRNKHTSPFEMIEVWLEMKLPIFVARQFVRHRTVGLNEVSARYVKLPAEWYIPEFEHVGWKPANVKQGRVIAGDETTLGPAIKFCEKLDFICRQSYLQYEDALMDGIPNEVARCFLHLNHYTHWLWKQDLWNLFHFLTLRSHSHAQWEAQQYAQAILALLEPHLPATMALWRKHCQLPPA